MYWSAWETLCNRLRWGLLCPFFVESSLAFKIELSVASWSSQTSIYPTARTCKAVWIIATSYIMQINILDLVHPVTRGGETVAWTNGGSQGVLFAEFSDDHPSYTDPSLSTAITSLYPIFSNPGLWPTPSVHLCYCNNDPVLFYQEMLQSEAHKQNWAKCYYLEGLLSCCRKDFYSLSLIVTARAFLARGCHQWYTGRTLLIAFLHLWLIA